MWGWWLGVAWSQSLPIPGTVLEDALTPARCRSEPPPRVAWRLDLGPMDAGCSLEPAGDDTWLVIVDGRVVRFDLHGQVLGELTGGNEAAATALIWHEGPWITPTSGVERWSPHLAPQWFVALPEMSPLTGAPVLGQLDDDPALEVVVAGEKGVAWLDDDGTVLGTGPGARPGILGGRVIGHRASVIGPVGDEPWLAAGFYEASTAPPVVADTDGDGENELLALLGANLAAFRPDGSLLWIVRMHQPPHDRTEGWSPISRGPMAWSSEAGCALVASSSNRGADDRAVHCTGPDGMRWRQPTPGSGSRAGVVLGDVDGRRGDEVLVALDAGEVWALDLQGRIRWRWSTEGPLTCPPAVAKTPRGRPLVLVGTQQGLVALRPRRSRGC